MAATLRSQYPLLIKEYAFSHSIKPPIVSGILLKKKGVLGSLGTLRRSSVCVTRCRSLGEDDDHEPEKKTNCGDPRGLM